MILKLGDTGPDVEKLQEYIGADQDGKFGPATEQMIKDYQTDHGLKADGIVGPITLSYLGLDLSTSTSPIVVAPSPISGDTSNYRQLFDSMVIRSNWQEPAEAAANEVLRGAARYQALAPKVNVPWYLIGAIHLMEGDCNFNTHLHNGDSLKARTHNVPAGRPVHGNPPFTWEESAIDALSYDNIKPPLDTIGQQFSALEHFNGMGYHSHGINTPYLWSGTNHYSAGKYVSDGHWSSSAVSEQVGAACIYKIFLDRGIIKI